MPLTATAVRTCENFQSAKKIGTSPQKFAKPGSPMLAKVAARKRAARTGAPLARPPMWSMSKVWVRWYTLVERRKRSATDRPCATISMTTPPTPSTEPAAIPRKA